MFYPVLWIRNPVPYFDPGIRDGYKVRIRIRDPDPSRIRIHPGSGLNNPDISFSLETTFLVENIEADPDLGWKKIGSGIEKIRIWDPV